MTRGPVYFPYLRGKQFELLALQDVSSRLATHGGVLPIIEPVNLNTAGILRAVKHYVSSGMRFCVTVNPRVGELVGAAATIHTKIVAPLTASNIVPGLQLTSGMTLANLTAFLGQYSKSDVVLVHWDPALQPAQVHQATERHPKTVRHVFVEKRLPDEYVKTFSGALRATLADGFRAEEKNADYPEETFFSDAWHNYAKSKWTGFGDFLIVGAAYRKGGGPAHAVAIHLTHDQTKPPSVYCRHFVSNDTTGQANPGGKYLQSVAKLVKYIARKPSAWTYSTACTEFKQHHSDGHYPGLGVVKRLSMRHHLELMMHLL